MSETPTYQEDVNYDDLPLVQGKPAIASALATVPPSQTPALPPSGPVAERYAGASLLELTEDQKATLLGKVDEDDVDILPTGEVYLSQVRYRRLLNEVFGPGRWALVPLSTPNREKSYVCQEWGLYADGNFVSSAWGEQDFQMGSHTMSYPMALEGAKSTAIMRCCKDLGIASELWDRRWVEKFKARHCVKAQRRKSSASWRLKASDPFYDEIPSATQAAKAGTNVAPTPDAGLAPGPEQHVRLESVAEAANLPFEDVVATLRAIRTPANPLAAESATESFLKNAALHLERVGEERFRRVLTTFKVRSPAELVTPEQRVRFLSYIQKLEA